MDSNQPVNQTPTQQTPPTPAPQQQPQVLAQQTDPIPQPTPPAEGTGSKNMMIIWIIVGLIVLILAIGGVYLYMNRTPAPKVQTTPPQTTQAQGTLEDELNALDVDSEGSDFSEVDKDLQSL